MKAGQTVTTIDAAMAATAVSPGQPGGGGARGSSVWRWPAWLALASAGGLLAALLGDGVWDAASWCLLGWPAAVGLWFGLPPMPRLSRRVPSLAWPGGRKAFSRQGI